MIALTICIAHDLALLTNEVFMEVDAPLLHPFQGDSTSRPIFAETATYDGLLFTLASSPELYLKKLLDFSKPWKRISIHDTLLEKFGKDLYELDYDELVNTARIVGIEYSEPVSNY